MTIAAIAIFATACDSPDDIPKPDQAFAAEIGDHEDAVCGMYVREQPAPRAQVVHRDGTRLFLCSIGDLLVHLSVPSPHGTAQQVFVEVLSPDVDPAASNTGAHPWLDANAASYVVGVPRRGIMGPPLLAYADRAVATVVAAKYDGARVLDFSQLETWWADRQDGPGERNHGSDNGDVADAKVACA